jgi:hypothetical protein
MMWKKILLNEQNYEYYMVIMIVNKKMGRQTMEVSELD